MKKHTFTLIELLMTVAIVVILAGILIPSVNSAIKKGQQAKAKAEIVTLVNAIKQYENTYNRLPKYTENTSMDVPENLIKALQGDATVDPKAKNPRKIKFLDKRNTGAGKYEDPWGENYIIIFSTTESIALESIYAGDLTHATIYESVVIWSKGPDKKPNTKDDVHSFEAEYDYVEPEDPPGGDGHWQWKVADSD